MSAHHEDRAAVAATRSERPTSSNSGNPILQTDEHGDETANPRALHRAPISVRQRRDASETVVLNNTTGSVRWRGKRCHLGCSIEFRCLEALSARTGESVENNDLVAAIDTGFIEAPNDARVAVYRLKRKLINGGMEALAERIENVRGAYVLRA